MARNVPVGGYEGGKEGQLKTLLVSPIVLVGKARGRVAHSRAKYRVFVDFSEANSGMY